MFVPTGWLVSFAAWVVLTLVLWRGDFPRWFTLVDMLGWLVLLLFCVRYVVAYAVLYSTLQGLRVMLKSYRPELNHFWIPPKRGDEWARLLQELDLALAKEEAFAHQPTPRFESYSKRLERWTQGLVLVNTCISKIRQVWSWVDNAQRQWAASQLDELTQVIRDLTPPDSDQCALSQDFRDRLLEQAFDLERVRATATSLLSKQRRDRVHWSPLAYQVHHAWEVVHAAEVSIGSPQVES